MRLDKQKDTSRRNGARSRGPVTAAGKQRSSANSYKHGIGSRALLIPGESQADLDAHFGGYRDRFNPADAVELDLVDNRAFITWRQRRLWRREADIVTLRTEYEPKANSDAQREAASEAWRDMRIRGQAECTPALVSFTTQRARHRH